MRPELMFEGTSKPTDNLLDLYVRLKDELVRTVLADDNPYPEGVRTVHAHEGSIKPMDALLLAELLRRNRPRRILEIGSYLGFSTRWLLEVTAHREMEAFDRAIDLRITRLRRKIEVDPAHPEAIRTVRGVGYMFVPPKD